MTNYDTLPDYMQEGMKRYIEDGIKPGSFMYHILCNDFPRAIRSSDRANKHNLLVYAEWLINEAPGECWGSVDNVRYWMLLQKLGIKDETIAQLRAEIKALEDRMHG
jgi:hypothetical protein